MIISPYKNGYIDPVVHKIIEGVNSDVPLVPVTRYKDFQFNDKLKELKDWILVDYIENGANDWDMSETLLFGKDISIFKEYDNAEWQKFNEFVANYPPLIYFKRELLKKDVTNIILPIDYPSTWYNKIEINEKSFNERPIEVFNNWGYSHELRRVTHGEIFIHAAHNGIEIIDNIHTLNYMIQGGYSGHNRLWVTVYSPYFARLDMRMIYDVQNMSKLSLSLPGAGRKCFRHTEASLSSVMVMMDDDLAWSYEWVHGFNCIKVPKAESFEEIKGMVNHHKVIDTIEYALKRTDLYPIFQNGTETCNQYRYDNYKTNYIEKILNGL